MESLAPGPHISHLDDNTPTRTELRWTAVLFGLVGGLLLGVLLMPGVTLEQILYLAMHGICAQTHNLVAGGFQFPLCARDSGMYLSYLVTLGVVFARGRGLAGRLPPLPISLIILLLFVIMAVDGLNSTLAEFDFPHAYTPRDDLRLLTGMGAGIGLALVVLLVINTALRRDVQDQLYSIGTWRELGMIILINVLIIAAIYADLLILAVPLALLTAVAVVFNLAAVMMLIPSLFLGLGGRVTRNTQLAHPAFIGLVLALTFLIALARYRIWMEVLGFLPPPLLP
ncbi:DUF2085 domain-containing protein [Candidatus Oscillochloris fontis]|uniref:DUF2085 domain-containing protein n=1 Tax=Candidatus Oscillochloris fontis TaxID=2496868 RepID=UPI00101BE99B|nr:DUF2085 domain-containing protein [Candidatus Oscillochloris fontis]